MANENITTNAAHDSAKPAPNAPVKAQTEGEPKREEDPKHENENKPAPAQPGKVEPPRK